MSKNNLVKCLRCQKVLIQEEQAGHICTPELKGVIYLDIDYLVETKSETGEPLFLVKGLNGYLYRLTKKTKQTFIELSSPESKQGDDFEHEPREGNSSEVSILYTPYIPTGLPVDKCLRQKRS